MKVCLATPLYPPESGGPATFAKVLEEGLGSRGWTGETVRFSGVRHLPKLVRHAVYFWHVYRVARRSDVVLALDPVSTGVPALLAARLAFKPFYVRVAGDYAWEQGTARFKVTDSLDTFTCNTRYPLAVRALKAVQSYVAIASTGIIVPSLYLAKLVHLWDIPREMIRVAYNAAPDVSGVSAQSPRDGAYIVSVGRLVKWKGMDHAIRAFASMRERFPQLTLVIIGDGPEKAVLETLVADLDIEDVVLFTGSLTRSETLAYIRHAKAFVLNTRYEGLSHLILEAFALGTPVATTPVGGNRELIEEGKTGLLFEPNDTDGIVECLTELLESDALRTRIGAAEKAHAAAFTNDAMIEAVISALSTRHT